MFTKPATTSNIKNAIEKITGCKVKLDSWKCDSHFEGSAKAYRNPEKEKHGKRIVWKGEVASEGECWYAKTKADCHKNALCMLAREMGHADLANAINDKMEQASWAAFHDRCGY